MTYQNLSKFLLSAATFSLISLPSWGASGQAGATIDSFLTTNFSPVSSGDVLFRFTELFEASGTNNSTHILIDGLVELEDGSGILSSTYAGIDIATGTEYDIGQVLLTLPSGAQTTGATSPIVGIVPRTTPTSGGSGWSSFTNAATVSTFGGASGTVDFDSTAGTLDFNLTLGGTAYTGTANYTTSQDGSTMSIEAFSLTGGGNTFNFEASELLVINGDAAGVIVSADSSPAYDSLLFNLSLTGLNGSSTFIGKPVDGNGFADLTGHLGFVNVNFAPWYYLFNVNAFVFIPNEPTVGQGFWGYVSKSGAVDPANVGTSWGGYSADGNGWLNTNNWLGFVNIADAPFIYILGYNTWGFYDAFAFAPEPQAGASGGWVYFFPKAI